MTMQRSLDLDCPKCAGRQSVMVYDTINVSLDPTLKEKLFNGEINFFQCEKCGERAFIQIPLLYHDMDKGFMVQFYPFEGVQHREFLALFTRDGEIAAVDGLPRKVREGFKRVQIVFDMGEMVRYVIFRERLHELWKDAS